MERIVTLSNNYESSAVTIEEISQDTSGRSFVIKIPDGRAFFWCSEKSKLSGVELLGKMKDLLCRRPSVAELTGIDESRLECFATYIRAYLMGSAVCNTQASVSISPAVSTVTTLGSMSKNAQSSSASASKPLPSLSASSQATKVNSLYQGSLSPRISSFKEAVPRSFLCSRSSVTREKLKKRVEYTLTAVDDSSTASQLPPGTPNSKTGDIVKSEGHIINPFSPGFLESLGKLTIPPSLSSVSQVPFTAQPIFSPYYCWCPPGASTSQRSLSAPNLLSPANDSILPPPSLLQPAPSAPSINLADLPPFDFPAFLPDPLVCLPKPASQQIPTFTPLICDPIVHVPVIDVCSAGQGYLVSAGPTVSTNISPLHPKLMNPLIPETDSMVEEGARKTLRLLLSRSGPTNPPFMGVLPLPAVLGDEKPSGGAIVSGSRGLYCGTRDVDAIIASSFATMGLITKPESKGCGDDSCSDDDNVKEDGNAGLCDVTKGSST
ncbi:hypothetical protein CRG98_040070 [Punica granatum]|nr:hypothetical protein CRG98_040070 [Punica granatum]